MATPAPQGMAKQAGDLDSTLKDLNLSNEEVDKFQKAFKDPEFLKLFSEYAKEVSDPKVKEETDLYLRQLESEGRAEEVYGKGMVLIVPTEAFVVRTKDTATKQKAFINVCTSDKIERLSMKSGTGSTGRTGAHVSIPLSLTAQKEGQDKAGQPCMVWDFIVHPDTVVMAQRNVGIKKLLVETAMENILKSYKVQLADDYKVIKLKYKSTPTAPKPQVVSVRATKDGSGLAGSRVQPLPNAPAVPGLAAQPAPAAARGVKTAVAGQLQAVDNPAAGAAGGRSTFKFPTAKPKQPSTKLAPQQAGYKHESGEVTPAWELIHRGQVDLGDCWGDSGRQLVAAAPPSYPQELVLRVQLPGCTSAAGLQLDASMQTISIVVPGRFKLEAPLPFPVSDKDGKAKFDKAKQQLEVVLPTLPPVRAPLPPAAVVASEAQQDMFEEADTHAGVVQPQNQDQEQAGTADSDDDRGAAVETQQGQQAPSNSSALVPPVEDARDTVDGATTGLTDNQRKWAELHDSRLDVGTDQTVRMTEDTTVGEPHNQVPDSSAAGVMSSSGTGVCGDADQQEQVTATPVVPNTWLAPRLCNTLTDELD